MDSRILCCYESFISTQALCAKSWDLILTRYFTIKRWEAIVVHQKNVSSITILKWLGHRKLFQWKCWPTVQWIKYFLIDCTLDLIISISKSVHQYQGPIVPKHIWTMCISALPSEHFLKLLWFIYNIIIIYIILYQLPLPQKHYYTHFSLGRDGLMQFIGRQYVLWCDFSRNIRCDSVWNIPALSESDCRSKEGLRGRPGWELWRGHQLLQTCCQVLSAHCKTCVTKSRNKMHYIMTHFWSAQEYPSLLLLKIVQLYSLFFCLIVPVLSCVILVACYYR